MKHRKLLFAPLIFASFLIAQSDSYAQGIPVQLSNSIHVSFFAKVEASSQHPVVGILIESALDSRSYTQTATGYILTEEGPFVVAGTCRDVLDTPGALNYSHFECSLGRLDSEIQVTMRWTTSTSIIERGGVPLGTNIVAHVSAQDATGRIDVIRNLRVLEHESYMDPTTYVFL